MLAQTIAVALVHILAKVLGQALGFSYGVPDSLVRPKSYFIIILLVGPQMRDLTHQENGVIFKRIKFGFTAQECKKTCILAWIS